MKTHGNFKLRTLVAVFMAIGLNVVWALLIAWLYTMWNYNLAEPPIYEDLTFDADGRPLVHWRLDDMEHFRTLDGESVNDTAPARQAIAYFDSQQRRQHWFQPPLNWPGRINWATYSQRPTGAATWYLIQEHDQDDEIYLVGYDDVSRMRIGFLGRNGFRSTLPPPGERIEVGRGAVTGLPSRILGSTLGSNYRGDFYVEEGMAPPWRLYVLVEGGDLLEIDLRERSVRKLASTPDAQTLDFLTEPGESHGAGSTGEAAPREPAAPGQNAKTTRLAIRTPNQIRLLDLDGQAVSVITLPEELKDERTLSVLELPAAQFYMFAAAPYATERRSFTLYRTDQEGQVLERHSVELAGYQPPTDLETSLARAALLPSPAAWMAMGTTYGAATQVFENRATTLPQGIRVFAERYWVLYALAIAAGLIAAMAVARLERRQYGAHGRAWAIATLLAGPAMLLAYLAEHRGPALATCPSCGRRVPNTRDACPACHTAFPEPALTGVEVFA